MMYRGGQGGQTMIPGGALGKAKYALSLGRPDEAERICRKRLEKDAGDVGARVVLAQALLQTGGLASRFTGGVPEEAVRAARKAVDLQPRAAKTHVQLAEALVAKKDMVGARAEADIAVKLEPRLAGAHLIRAIVLRVGMGSGLAWRGIELPGRRRSRTTAKRVAA